MSGIYTVTFSGVAITAQQDLMALVAHSSKQCVLLGFGIAYTGRSIVLVCVLGCFFMLLAYWYNLVMPSIFVLKGTAPKELGVTMWDIIKGVIPFILIIMLVLVLCSIFPEIILWLPEKMIGSA